MGNRHSSHKKKIVINGQHPDQGRGDGVESVSISSSTGFAQEPFIIRNPVKQSEGPANNDEKECPPTPCIGVNPKGKTDQTVEEVTPVNDGYIRPTDVVNELYSVHKEGTEMNLATKSTIGAAEMDSTESKEEDDRVTTISDMSADDEVDVYDRIHPIETERNGRIWHNPEYFTRGCWGRCSERTNSSNADSAYTDSTNNTHGFQACSNEYFCYDCMACRAPNMEYMTDVYKRTLQRDLKVQEILPDLHFIDDLKKEEILKTNKYSGQEAVDMLLESVKSSEDEGKWQTFTEALENSGYSRIVQLLKVETENDQEKNRKVLSLLLKHLISDINVVECMDLLFEKELLNVQDKDEIEAELKNNCATVAAYKMFTILPSKSLEWDQELPLILDKCGFSQIAKLLQFSSEHPPEHITDKTHLKECTCSGAMQRHQYMRMDSRTLTHETYPHRSNNHNQELHVSTEVGKNITELSKHVHSIEVKAQKQLTIVAKLEKKHSNDLADVKETLTQTATEVQRHLDKVTEQENWLKEIKQELKKQDMQMIKMHLQHQHNFEELKNSLCDIKGSISALTRLIGPSLPAACRRSAHLTLDSGFSGRSDSLMEECLEEQIYSEFQKPRGNEEDYISSKL